MVKVMVWEQREVIQRPVVSQQRKQRIESFFMIGGCFILSCDTGHGSKILGFWRDFASCLSIFVWNTISDQTDMSHECFFCFSFDIVTLEELLLDNGQASDFLNQCEVGFEDIKMVLQQKGKKPDRVILDGSFKGTARPGRMVSSTFVFNFQIRPHSRIDASKNCHY